MATGSGKSLVIVKLVQLLKNLIALGKSQPMTFFNSPTETTLLNNLRGILMSLTTENNEIHIHLRN